MIPKILHQIFISNKKFSAIPSQWKQYAKKAKKIHKSWEYRFWDAQAIKSLIDQYYPQLTPYFTNDTPFVIRADIARYIILYHIGGWYFDYDYELLQALDEWNTNTIILPYERDADIDEQGINQIGNSILASEPKHWYWMKVIETLPDASFFTPDIQHEDIISTTGPGKLTQLYNELSPSEKKEITCPDRLIFHYPTLHHMSHKEYQHILGLPNVYGLHHTHSSWRDTELKKNIRRRKYLANRFIRPIFMWWGNYLEKKHSSQS